MAALAFGAGLHATPGPSIWKMILAAVITLAVWTVCWSTITSLAKKHIARRTLTLRMALWLSIITTLLQVPGITLPLFLGSNDLGNWLADTLGLL
ncbi:hypothetical protein [Streptomyces sp. A1136]|uniref:hypothetical protein n=1 Tax=Streptomyces sp. A1136 TaxID=2563102 RepID=UPI00109E8B27|nr:hypothetical protein [Streptomyces sp. A1136]THA44797.1 hypothetical protein E6R62_36345 [Streptomyces sp. A1136]